MSWALRQKSGLDKAPHLTFETPPGAMAAMQCQSPQNVPGSVRSVERVVRHKAVPSLVCLVLAARPAQPALQLLFIPTDPGATAQPWLAETTTPLPCLGTALPLCPGDALIPHPWAMWALRPVFTGWRGGKITFFLKLLSITGSIFHIKLERVKSRCLP